ncbi:hypothetical protein CHS0354_024061 [Potamilus streckersoni]|uniref:Metallo-beta-lactamase domain-containing protein n=1 Tax=Potamilus streckersoni TaxID=2493646 RepID=A0AAE0VMQ0_9BIVA|nr:hypothetical protein CHS0354_024061 [Potamilus streckersoni]
MKEKKENNRKASRVTGSRQRPGIVAIVLLVLCACFLSCMYKQYPNNPLEKILKLDDPKNVQSEHDFFEMYQKEFFTPEEIQQLNEFGGDYSTNDVYEAIGEKREVGTTIVFQRMHDVYLDGYAYLQTGIKRIVAYIGYLGYEFKRVKFGRKLDFHLMKRIPYFRDPQRLQINVETDSGNVQSLFILVPYIYEITGVVDSMEVNADEPFQISVNTDGMVDIMIYNKSPIAGEDRINVISKSVDNAQIPVVFTKEDMDELQTGFAYVSISARNQLQFEKIETFVAEKKLTVKMILNTHGHCDHVADNAHLQRTFKAPILIHHADEWRIQQPLKEAFPIPFHVEPTKATTLLKERDFLTLSENIGLEVLETPGHSKGSVCFFERRKKLLFCGDVLFKESIGRYDFIDSDFDELMNSIQKLLLLGDNVKVFPGHGKPTTLGHERMHNPFLQTFRKK